MDETSSHDLCPFCQRNNLLKTEVLAETDDAYLIPALGDKGNYLIIPKEHVESPNGLPDTWWRDVKELLVHAPRMEHFNLSFNLGAHAGQSVKHVHMWVIPRDGGSAATGKGLARLIQEAS